MAIANLVKYDSTFDLELTHPITGEPIGVVFQIRSESSPEAKVVVRKEIDSMAVDIRKNKLPPAAKRESFELEKKAACIAGWDWGGQEFEKGQGVLEYSRENCIKVLQIDWIYNQVATASADLGNFTDR